MIMKKNDKIKIKIYQMPSTVCATYKNGEQENLVLCADDRREIRDFILCMVKKFLNENERE